MVVINLEKERKKAKITQSHYADMPFDRSVHGYAPDIEVSAIHLLLVRESFLLPYHTRLEETDMVMITSSFDVASVQVF